MKRYFKFMVVMSLLALHACTNEDKKAQAPQKPTEHFLDYQVTAEEDAENAIILLQFRKGEEEGAGLALEEGSHITFDGEPVAADSAKLAGVFYEVQRPLKDFAGEHVIVFTDKLGQAFEERFTYEPIQLNNIGPIVSRNNLVLGIAGISDNSTVQVTITDTSFQTADINDTFKVTDGQVALGRASLQNLASGPIHLELHKEEVKSLAHGRLLIHYALRRDLELKD